MYKYFSSQKKIVTTLINSIYILVTTFIYINVLPFLTDQINYVLPL